MSEGTETTDEWMRDFSKQLGIKRLHALGCVSQQWNEAERWLFELFCDVSGLSTEDAWLLTYDLSSIALCSRIRILAARKELEARPLIENVITAFDQCRKNRNALVHAWSVNTFSPGERILARRSKKPSSPDVTPFRSGVDDIRRVADEISAVKTRMWLLSCFNDDHYDLAELEMLPIPEAIST